MCRRVLLLAAALLAVAASAALGASQAASYQVKWLPVRDCGPGGRHRSKMLHRMPLPERLLSAQQLINPSPSCSTAEEPQWYVSNVLHGLGLRTARLSS